MIRHKWIISFRNRLSSMIMELDSCASIEGSRLTEKEREDLKSQLRKSLNYIDNKLFK